MNYEAIIEQIIQACSMYSDIPLQKDIFKKMLSIAHIKEYNKGEILLRIGEKYENIGFILAGSMRSYYLDENGKDITKYFHTSNKLIMDESLVEYEKSICNYEAMENCSIIIAPVKQFKRILLQDECLKSMYIKSLEKALCYKIERENQFLTKNATERYLEFKKNYPSLDKKIKNSYIATYLGITPESLSRIRRTLKEKNEE
ncbi:MAG: Crp/Fnr family transcriptional regulator [Acutalibacteraceae bacterium]|nr:Crp/Fnr family transcriptional regulator [Acutalibacteraceae bacterium]